MTPLPCITAIVASAGTGKTTRIVEDIAREVEFRDPEQIVATTFGVKAAAEIIERARARLFSMGRANQAARLLGAHFGTVNSVCAQIVAQHAFELERSPEMGVVPEDGARLLRTAAVAVFERYARDLNAIGERFGHEEPRAFGEKPDWRNHVLRVVELGRANGLNPEGIQKSGERSLRSLEAVLAPLDSSKAADLDEALRQALEHAVPLLDGNLSKTASGSTELIRRSARMLRRGESPIWPDWARLTKVGAAKKDGPGVNVAFEAVAAAASAHPRHPRLREDLASYIHDVFACAADSLAVFQQFKAERGVLDFIDQETLALQVLRNPDSRARLGERIGRVFVDEFQDSSPLQLAIFMALAGMVEESTWVGDPKQAIYGFRNADSTLTQAAFDAVRAANDRPQQTLSESWRSREEIVRFVNAAFGPAFATMGLPEKDHTFTGTGRVETAFTRPPLAVWRLNGKVEEQYGALAAQVREILGEAASWLVAIKQDSKTRPLQAGDVAILCRSNEHVRKMAAALAAQGLHVSVEREGLTGTPHIQLVVAAVRWVADSSDRLALAELARFFAADPHSDTWLQAAAADPPEAALRNALPIADDLQLLRERILMLTPAEMVDAVSRHRLVQQRLESWGDVAERLDDLEALRGFAFRYEEACGAEGMPATLNGLILALDADPPPRPRSLRPDAVQVTTYHGAKGLEWPLVILTGLDREPQPRLFEPVAEADGAIDLSDPLADRRIRFWPWPYGGLKKDLDLDTRAATSAIGTEAERKAREEETRLLYVGVTRARDYLVLAPPQRGEAWLHLLNVGETNHVELPKIPGDPLKAGASSFAAEAVSISVKDALPQPDPTPTFVYCPREAIIRPPLRRRPSGEETAGAFEVVERIELGKRLPLTGDADMEAIGNALHAVFAADDGLDDRALRLQRAKAILSRWKTFQVQAADVIAAADRLEAHIRQRWPGGAILREAPLAARIDGQLITGRIDVLVAHEGRHIVIDHKSYPGTKAEQQRRAAGHGAQLALYAKAIETATGRRCEELYIHMPLTGSLLRIAPAARAGLG